MIRELEQIVKDFRAEDWREVEPYVFEVFAGELVVCRGRLSELKKAARAEVIGYGWLTKKAEELRAKVSAEAVAQSRYAAGTIFVGGRDFDDRLALIVTEAFLGEYNQSRDKNAAYEAGALAGREAVDNWNNRESKGRAGFFNRGAELKRSEAAGESIALALLTMFNV